MESVAPLVVIVGETASGKSALGIELAKRFDGEIICADSRTIYRGMNIGTAKPNKTEQAGISHYLLDVVSPEQTYSAAQFKTDASKAIEQIGKQKKLPIMVGGSGLYIDSILFDYQFMTGNVERDPQNPRHLLKQIDSDNSSTNLQHLRPNTLIIGLKIEKDRLEQKITERVEHMVSNGFVDEVKLLADEYGWDNEALNGIGYKQLGQYIRGECRLVEAKSQTIREHLRFAKRQRTWFKRNKYIHWIDNPDDARDLVKTFLNQTE